MKTKICVICGKEFTVKGKGGNNRIRCYDKHPGICCICGKEVEDSRNPDKSSITCSNECSRELRKRNWAKTCIERYGSASSFQSPLATQRRNKALSSENCKEKRARTCLEKYGVDNVRKSQQFREHYKEVMNKKYGVDNYYQSEDCRQRKIEALGTDNFYTSDLCRQRIKEKYGVDSVQQIPEVQQKISESLRRAVALDGTVFDSQTEVEIYEICKQLNLKVERNIPLQYYYEKDRVTYIDFMIEGFLFEAKGNTLLYGYFDKGHVPILEKLKVYKDNNVTLIVNDSFNVKKTNPEVYEILTNGLTVVSINNFKQFLQKLKGDNHND